MESMRLLLKRGMLQNMRMRRFRWMLNIELILVFVRIQLKMK